MAHLHQLTEVYFMLGLKHGDIPMLVSTVDNIGMTVHTLG